MGPAATGRTDGDEDLGIAAALAVHELALAGLAVVGAVRAAHARERGVV